MYLQPLQLYLCVFAIVCVCVQLVRLFMLFICTHSQAPSECRYSRSPSLFHSLFVFAVVNAFFKQIANHCLTIVSARVEKHSRCDFLPLYAAHATLLSLALPLSLSLSIYPPACLFTPLLALRVACESANRNDSDLVFGSLYCYIYLFFSFSPLFRHTHAVYYIEVSFGYAQSLMLSFKNGICVICQCGRGIDRERQGQRVGSH